MTDMIPRPHDQGYFIVAPLHPEQMKALIGEWRGVEFVKTEYVQINRAGRRKQAAAHRRRISV